MIDLGALLSPIQRVVPPPLRPGASAVVPGLDSPAGRALLDTVGAEAARAVAGTAGQAIAQALTREAATLSGVLDAGQGLDELADQGQQVVAAAIQELTVIAAECLRELTQAAPAAVMNPAGGMAMLLPIALRHWSRAQARYDAMEAEMTQLTHQVEQVEVPSPQAGPAVTAPMGDGGEGGGGVAEKIEDNAAAPSDQAQRAVAAAKSALGTPYQWGGTTPGQGLDCSGLTQWAYAQAGVDIPRTADAQAVGPQIPRDQLQPGDLAVWDGHVAMIVEGGQMIEAGDPVQINPIRQDNIGMNFKGFYRPTAA